MRIWALELAGTVLGQQRPHTVPGENVRSDRAVGAAAVGNDEIDLRTSGCMRSS